MVLGANSYALLIDWPPLLPCLLVEQRAEWSSGAAEWFVGIVSHCTVVRFLRPDDTLIYHTNYTNKEQTIIYSMN